MIELIKVSVRQYMFALYAKDRISLPLFSSSPNPASPLVNLIPFMQRFEVVRFEHQCRSSSFDMNQEALSRD